MVQFYTHFGYQNGFFQENATFGQVVDLFHPKGETKIKKRVFILFQFQSHQIFHLLVIVAAFINYRGISELASWRGSGNSCEGKLSSLFEPTGMHQHVPEL